MRIVFGVAVEAADENGWAALRLSPVDEPS